MGLIHNNFDFVEHVRLQKAYPERVAQIHMINPPTILSAVMAMFKPLLQEKIRKRVSKTQTNIQKSDSWTIKFFFYGVLQIIVHRNFQSLLEYVPLKYLPKDYGGESPSLAELHGKRFIVYFFHPKRTTFKTKTIRYRDSASNSRRPSTVSQDLPWKTQSDRKKFIVLKRIKIYIFYELPCTYIIIVLHLHIPNDIFVFLWKKF